MMIRFSGMVYVGVNFGCMEVALGSLLKPPRPRTRERSTAKLLQEIFEVIVTHMKRELTKVTTRYPPSLHFNHKTLAY